MKATRFLPFILTILLGFWFMAFISCEEESPLNKVLRQREKFQVEVLSWAIVENQTIIANVRLKGPMRSSLEYITIRFDQYDGSKNLVKKDWIPFDLSELKALGSKDYTLSIECGSTSVSHLAALVLYEPSKEDMKNLKELDELL